jgi:DNA polymerase-3 subunit epsilon
MKKVRDVDWRTTPTELEAMLLESRLIKEQKPRFNRAQRRYRGRPFIRIDTTEQFPRVSWEYNLEGDGAEYYGPLRHRDQAELIVELISRFFQLRKCDDDKLRLGQRCLYADMDRCTAPCENEDAERYAAVVDRVRAFLTGQDKSVLDRLEERMQQASKQLEFEKAAQFRDWLEELERILEKQEAVAAPVLQHNAAVVHPQPDRPTVQVTLVRHGRPARTLALDPALPPEATARLQDAVRAVFDPDETPPASYSKRAIDEIRLLSHWMFKERDHVTQQRWQGAAPDAFTATIADTIQAHAEADAETAAA